MASQLRTALSPSRPIPRIILAIAAGLLAAVVAYVILGSYRDSAARQTPLAIPSAPLEPTLSRDSLSHRVAAGKVIIGVPTAGQDVLLSELRPGDALDVFAILPAEPGQAAASVTVAHKATVLQRVGRPGGPVLLEALPEESLALAHLIGRGARLTYAVWPSAAASSPGPLGGSGATTATP